MKIYKLLLVSTILLTIFSGCRKGERGEIGPKGEEGHSPITQEVFKFNQIGKVTTVFNNITLSDGTPFGGDIAKDTAIFEYSTFDDFNAILSNGSSIAKTQIEINLGNNPVGLDNSFIKLTILYDIELDLSQIGMNNIRSIDLQLSISKKVGDELHIKRFYSKLGKFDTLKLITLKSLSYNVDTAELSFELDAIEKNTSFSTISEAPTASIKGKVIVKKIVY